MSAGQFGVMEPSGNVCPNEIFGTGKESAQSTFSGESQTSRSGLKYRPSGHWYKEGSPLLQ